MRLHTPRNVPYVPHVPLRHEIRANDKGVKPYKTGLFRASNIFRALRHVRALTQRVLRMSFEAEQFLGNLFGLDIQVPGPGSSGTKREAAIMPEPAQAITRGRPQLVTEPVPEPIDELDTTDLWPEAEPWPDPCDQCGTSELWQNALGRWRCIICDPPIKARLWLDKAERIRQRYEGTSQVSMQH